MRSCRAPVAGEIFESASFFKRLLKLALSPRIFQLLAAQEIGRSVCLWPDVTQILWLIQLSRQCSLNHALLSERRRDTPEFARSPRIVMARSVARHNSLHSQVTDWSIC